MSRFWAASSDESSSEADSDDSSSSEEVKAPSKFTRGGAADSSSDDEGPRVVRSHKDKRFDELNTIIAAARKHMNIADWANVQADFEKMVKLLVKMKGIIASEGLPRSYVKLIVNIEDKVAAVSANKEEVKKMKGPNAKSLNALKQKLRKYTKEIEKDVKAYRANPDAAADEGSDDEESGSEEESESESEEAPAAKPAPAAKKPAAKPAADDDDDDSEEWPSDTESEESSSGDEGAGQVKGFDKWKKKEPSSNKPAKKEAAPKAPKVRAKKEVATTEKPEEKKAVALTEDAVDAKLKEIIAMRGKKGTDRKDQITQLQTLTEFTKVPAKLAEVLVHLTSAQFDVNRSMHQHMPVEVWHNCFANVSKLLEVVNTNPDVVLDEEGTNNAANDDEGDDGEVAKVSGNLLAFFERLDDELYKSLQFSDSHSPEYLKRLQDTQLILSMCDSIHKYYVGVGNLRAAARASLHKLDHLYFKHDDLVAATGGVKGDETCRQVIERLTGEIYTHADDRTKRRAMLCHIYYEALHGRYHAARDLLLMSHLQETIHQADIGTMIVFNRAMAQLGLCAFRNGLIEEAHSCLSEICGGARTRDMLAQGTSSASRADRNADQERQEKRHMVPYHMHLDLELLDGCHLVSAMLVEVPHMAANVYDSKRKVISKPLRRQFEHHERQVLAFPPESMREYVMSGARALRKGDWSECAKLVLELDVWNKFSRSKDEVKSMLRRKMQEEGLRTFLFTYSKHYDAMSLAQLCPMFDLEPDVVYSLVSKMIVSGELHAAWDKDSKAVLMHHVEPTRLQYLALQFSDKAAFFVENNERLLDTRFGSKERRGKDENRRGGKQGAGGRR